MSVKYQNENLIGAAQSRKEAPKPPINSKKDTTSLRQDVDGDSVVDDEVHSAVSAIDITESSRLSVAGLVTQVATGNLLSAQQKKGPTKDGSLEVVNGTAEVGSNAYKALADAALRRKEATSKESSTDSGLKLTFLEKAGVLAKATLETVGIGFGVPSKKTVLKKGTPSSEPETPNALHLASGKTAKEIRESKGEVIR